MLRNLVTGIALFFIIIATADCGEDVYKGPWPFDRDEWELAYEKEVWRDNKLGKDHWVPPPWKPVEVEKSAFSVWGRKIEMEQKALPVQIISQGIPLLAAPVTIMVETEKMEFGSIGLGKGSVKEANPDRVLYEGSIAADGIRINTRMELEFDGFTWITLQINKSDAVKIKRIAVDIPLMEYAAKYYTKAFAGYAPQLLMDMWGKVDKDRKLGLQNFDIGNEDIGISFFSEGRAGWWIQRRDRQVEWLKKDGFTTVRYNIVDLLVPQSITETREVSFGYNVLPLRPMPDDFRRYFVYTIGSEPERYKAWFDTGMTMVGIRLTSFQPEDRRKEATEKDPDGFALSYVPLDIPRPYNIEGFKKYVEEFHRYGAKVTIYTVGNHHHIQDPVFFKNFNELSGREPSVTREELEKALDMPGQAPGARAVCGWSSFVDYKVWFKVHWFKKLGLDGYYYDNQGFAACLNPGHKDHKYFDDKGQIQVVPLRRFREQHKRVYKEIKRIKPDSIIVGHESSSAYPFVDIAIGGEALSKLAGETGYYTEFFTPEDCKGLYLRGHQQGIPFLWLPEYRGKFQYGPESVKPARAMLSLLWLTDSCYWVAWSNTNVLLKDLQVRGKFKIWESEWLPFWEQEIATTDKKEIYIPVYKKTDSALLVVSNPSKESKETTVSINLTDLFPDGTNVSAVKITDAESDEVLEKMPLIYMEKRFVDVKIKIPDQDFRIIRIDAP